MCSARGEGAAAAQLTSQAGRAPEAQGPARDRPGVSTGRHSCRRRPRSRKAARAMSPSAALGSTAGHVTAQTGRRSLSDCHPEPKGLALKIDVGGASRASAKRCPALKGTHPRA